MRLLLVPLVLIGLVGCDKATPPPPPPPVAAFVPPTPTPPTQNAPICARPPEKAAFEMSTLKSQLMVTAISCQAEDKYNSFITRFRPDLVNSEKLLTAFFGRAYGRKAQQEQDDYITQTANAQSQLSIKSGPAFCQLNASLLDEALAVKSGADLPGFASTKPIQRSLAVEECSAPPPPPAKKKN